MSGNLFTAIEQQIAEPNKTFLESADGKTLSYGELLTLSARFAEALTALGVEPGDRVAVQVDKSVEALMLYLATLRAGAVYLPLNTGYTEAEVSYFLNDAEPRVVVCRPEDAETFKGIAASCNVPHVETLGTSGDGTLSEKAAAASGTFTTVARACDDLAAILYTSGTTGRSKGAMLTHRNLLSNAEALIECWRFSENDVLLHALPIFHTHGLFVATNVSLLARGSMLFLPRFDAKEIIRLLPRSTTMMGVPTFYSRLLAADGFTRELVAHIRLFISGSAPLSPEVHKEFEARTGHAILERYGMTETGMNSSNPYDGARRPGSVGFPLPGIEMRIADQETGTSLPQGEVGVIEIRGPNVFKGYWRMPEKTASEFRADGFFISGDLGMIDDLGYFNIVGRDKDLIISGGFNVYPAEIEAALDALDDIAESAVIGVPHADFGEGVTAVVALRPNREISEDNVREVLSKELAKYKVPKRIFTVSELPRNAMGKIQKKALREAYKDTYS